MYYKTKKYINKNIDSIAPDILEQIMQQDIPQITSEEELLFTPTTPDQGRIPHFSWWQLSSAAVALVMVILLLINPFTQSDPSVMELQIDVNPSISLTTTLSGQVRQIQALNQDAQTVIKHIKPNGNITQILPQIIKALNKNGYFCNSTNSILFSYLCSNEEKGLQQDIQRTINSCIKQEQLSVEVIYQTISPKEEITQAAETAGVSVGKYCFVKNLAQKYSLDAEMLYQDDLTSILNKVDKIKKREKQNTKRKKLSINKNTKKPKVSTKPSTAKTQKPSSVPNRKLTEKKDPTAGTKKDRTNRSEPKHNTKTIIQKKTQTNKKKSKKVKTKIKKIKKDKKPKLTEQRQNQKKSENQGNGNPPQTAENPDNANNKNKKEK